MIEKIKNNFLEARELLDEFIREGGNWVKLQAAGDMMVDAIKSGNKIVSFGNGGSMSDAMHFAEEMTGRFRKNRKPLAAIAIADPTHISCVANDYGYDQIFSRFVEAHGKKGDVLLAISTSGHSENVLKACLTGKEKGLRIVGLTGKGGGRLAALSDVELRAPQSEFADRAQEIHIKIIHSLIHYIELNV